MKAINIRSIRWGSVIAALCFSGAASANWTFQNTTVTPIGTGATTFNSQDAGASTATVQLAAVYAANSGFSTNKWAAATLTNQGGSGQGVCSTNDGNNCQSPDHAVDNTNNTEGVLLKFSSSVILSSIGLGWTNSSTSVDISLFRWMGDGAPPVVGSGAAAMTGWELVGEYGNMVQDTIPVYNAVNTNQANGTGAAGSGKRGSSWWMIAAYNSAFTATAKETRDAATLDNGNDYFKLFGVTGTTCANVAGADCGYKKLPEPATLALTSVALLGVAGLRRRKARLAA
jgi:hypothetical protein